MTNKTIREIESAAGRAGLTPGPRDRDGKLVWKVKCYTCGAIQLDHWAPLTSAERMLRKLRVMGWQVGNAKPKCPACLAHKETKMAAANGKAIIPMNEPSPPSNLLPTALPQPEPKVLNTAFNSANVIAGNRKLFALLEDQFDDKAKRYRAGYSDDRVAKETGFSVQFVASTRAGAFGELAEDPKLAALRDDIEMLRLEIDEFNKNTQKRLDQLAMRLAQVSA